MYGCVILRVFLREMLRATKAFNRCFIGLGIAPSNENRSERV